MRQPNGWDQGPPGLAEGCSQLGCTHRR